MARHGRLPCAMVARWQMLMLAGSLTACAARWDAQEALLERFPERDCFSDRLLTARSSLLERKSSLTARQTEVT